MGEKEKKGMQRREKVYNVRRGMEEKTKRKKERGRKDISGRRADPPTLTAFAKREKIHTAFFGDASARLPSLFKS